MMRRFGLLGMVLVCMVGCGQEPAKPAADTPGFTPPDPTADAAPAPAAPQADVEPFAADGMIVSVHAFFAAAKDAGDVELVAPNVAGKALVTADGMYAFIETPENEQQLADIAPDTPVRVEGMVHHPGRLLHVDAITALDTAPTLNLTMYATASGRQATLTGQNKCQCGIKISELHTGCALGHLHHLEADDGKLYHYLQFGEGQNLFKGSGSHFKAVTVTGTVLPGQWVLVQEAATQ
jgi:hypothetical protein